jgi:hypothetical protein
VGEEYKDFAVKELVSALQERNAERVQSIIALLEEFFGRDDRDIVWLKITSERFQNALKKSESGELEFLVALINLDAASNRFVGQFSAAVSQVVISEAAKLVEQGRAGKALELVSQLDFAQRTPSLHDLVLKALNQLKPGKDSPLRDLQVIKKVRIVAANDQNVKTAYVKSLEALILNDLKQGEINNSETQLAELVFLRPDPSAANDLLRLELSKQLFSKKEETRAFNILDQVKTGIPLGMRFKLFLSQIKLVNGAVGFFLFVSCSFLCIILVLKWLIVKLPLGKLLPAPKVWRQEEDRPYQRPFVRLESKSKLLSDEEYTDCLQVLGLKNDAGLAAIKAAYRQAVKLCHPDRHTQGEISSRFVELTTAYDKVLSIRKKLGLDR